MNGVWAGAVTAAGGTILGSAIAACVQVMVSRNTRGRILRQF